MTGSICTNVVAIATGQHAGRLAGKETTTQGQCIDERGEEEGRLGMRWLDVHRAVMVA